MAFFKFRKGGDESPSAPIQPESVEAMRRRAKHRLIGAAVLVLVGVIGFPLLFDTQPRPIAVDIPIDIPDRNKTRPLAAPVAQAPVAAGVVTPPAAPVQEEKTAAAPVPPALPAIKTEAKPAQAQPEAKVEAKPAAKPEPKPEVRPAPAADNGARAKALLEGKPAETAAAAEGRFVVQVGAFADADKARETRLKVEKAGLKTYTHVAETKEGKRIRVRVGPFASRAEADKAADRIKGLDLPAAILTL
jgi:DedD protein